MPVITMNQKTLQDQASWFFAKVLTDYLPCSVHTRHSNHPGFPYPLPAHSYLIPPGIPFPHVTRTRTPLPLSNHWSKASTRLTLTSVLKIPSYIPQTHIPQPPSITQLLVFSIVHTLHKICLLNMLCLLANSAS